jgi:putative oxidoreductase
MSAILTLDDRKPLSVSDFISAPANERAEAFAGFILSVVFFLRGAQKMLGWFGGFGLLGTMNFFTSQMHLPAIFAFPAICAEFFGSLGLIVGLLARTAAFGIAVNMMVAISVVHFANGPLMNWLGNQKGEGYE